MLITLLFLIMQVQNNFSKAKIKTKEGEFILNTSRRILADSSLYDANAVLKFIQEDLRILQRDYISRLPRERDRVNAAYILQEIGDLAALLYSLTIEGERMSEKPIDDDSFQELLYIVKNQWNTELKINVIEIAAKSNYFTVSQVSELMRLFYTDDGKIKVVEILNSQTLDPQNAYLLVQEVTFSYSKQKIKEIFNLR